MWITSPTSSIRLVVITVGDVDPKGKLGAVTVFSAGSLDDLVTAVEMARGFVSGERASVSRGDAYVL